MAENNMTGCLYNIGGGIPSCARDDRNVEAAVREPQQRGQIRKGGAARRAIMCSVMWLLRLLTTCCLVYLSASDSHTDLPLITDPVSTKSTTAAKRSVPTDAPMLNYIFDAHSTLNKHQHHHDHRWGPHFEGESKNMTVQAGGSAILDCRISLLQDKTVSWVRRQDNGEKVNLLTVEHQTYIGDPRYTVKFQYPDNWRLQIEPVNSSDEGQYECQVSTHPPKYIHVNLHINAPSVQIVDAVGEPLRDKYYEADSTIELLCVVRHIAMQVQYSVVQWLHGNRVLNYDTTRGGISVKTDLMEEGANSTLSIAKVGPADSGNYTCHLTTMPDQPATVHVHVLNGESLAELHHGSAELCCSGSCTLLLLLLLLLFVVLDRVQQQVLR